MGRSAHLWTSFAADADPVRDRLSRDDGRTVLEAVVALSIIALTALAWSQIASVAARTEVSGNQRDIAVDLASSEIEMLRATPGIETGADDAGGLALYDGLPIVTDPAGPVFTEDRDVDGTTFGIERFVLDPGSPSWRRLVVVVTWDDRGSPRDVRLDTAIPVLPDPVVVGA